MLARIFSIILLLALVGCDSFGSKKTKDLVELTPKLSVETQENISILEQETLQAIDYSALKNLNKYNLTRVSIISEPEIVENIVYSVSDLGEATAFSLSENKIIWNYNIGYNFGSGSYLGGGVNFKDGKLYIANGSKFLIILDAATGHELLRKEFADIIRTKPLLIDDVVIVQTVSNQIFAYDIVKGIMLWQHEGLNEIISTSKYVSPIIHDNLILTNFSSGQFYAIDFKSGEIKWNISLVDQIDVGLPNFEPSGLSCNPVIVDNKIYLASNNGKIIKADLTNGAVIWQIKAQDVQTMNLIGDSLFITNNARQAAAFNINDGKVMWAADLDVTTSTKIKRKTTLFQAPFITKSNNSLALNIIASNGELYSFAFDNNKLSIVPEISKIIPNIEYTIIKNNIIYLITNKQLAKLNL